MKKTDFISNFLKKENKILEIVYIIRLRLYLNFTLIFFIILRLMLQRLVQFCMNHMLKYRFSVLEARFYKFVYILWMIHSMLNWNLRIYLLTKSHERFFANWYIFIESKVKLRYGEIHILPIITYIWKVIDDKGASKRLILSYGFVIASNVRVWFVEKRLN